MVIVYKIYENIMDNRVSKSNIIIILYICKRATSIR